MSLAYLARFGTESYVGSNPTHPTFREVTKVLSTGALDASVSQFDSCLPDILSCSLTAE